MLVTVVTTEKSESLWSGGKTMNMKLTDLFTAELEREAAGTRRTVFFTPDGPGFVRLTVMDANGKADSVVVRLQ